MTTGEQEQVEDGDAVLARVEASGIRRAIAVGMLAILGGLLLYVAFASPPRAFGWQVFLLALGASSLWASERLRRATLRAVELTETELRDDTGEVLALTSEVLRVDRGPFAFKPSNGFTVVLDRRRGGRWLPGLWWRIGRRVAVGGVTPGHQTKMMADLLAGMLAERAALQDEARGR